MIELVTSLLAQDKVSAEQAASILQQMLPSDALSHLQVRPARLAARRLLCWSPAVQRSAGSQLESVCRAGRQPTDRSLPRPRPFGCRRTSAPPEPRVTCQRLAASATLAVTGALECHPALLWSGWWQGCQPLGTRGCEGGGCVSDATPRHAPPVPASRTQGTRTAVRDCSASAASGSMPRAAACCSLGCPSTSCSDPRSESGAAGVVPRSGYEPAQAMGSPRVGVPQAFSLEQVAAMQAAQNMGINFPSGAPGAARSRGGGEWRWRAALLHVHLAWLAAADLRAGRVPRCSTLPYPPPFTHAPPRCRRHAAGRPDVWWCAGPRAPHEHGQHAFQLRHRCWGHPACHP